MKLTDVYLPSGSDTINVSDGSAFHAGDTIEVSRPVTDAWVAFMGMDRLVRDGKRESWITGTLKTDRIIQNVAGDRLGLTVPLCDSYDAHYLDPPGSTVRNVTISGLISQVGIEHLQIDCPPQQIAITASQYQALEYDDVVDCWARDLRIKDTINSLEIDANSARLTVQSVDITHTVATVGAAAPADFGDHGTQVLYDHCTATGDGLFYFGTFGRTQGPNVLLNCEFHGNGHIQPHMRWSTGLLLDNCRVPEGSIDLMNRGEMGSGHGWAIGWAVAWNCRAETFLIQQPPGAMNWAIGCSGKRRSSAMPLQKSPLLPDGIFESEGQPVAPHSLYLQQLQQRLGPKAIKNIGY